MMLAFGNVLAVMATSQMCGVHLCPLVILSTPPLQHTFEFGSAPTAGHPTPLSTNHTFTAHLLGQRQRWSLSQASLST